MKISFSTNPFVFSACNFYLVLVHIFVVQQYFLEFNKRILMTLQVQNKFRMAAWNALFYAIPISCCIWLNRPQAIGGVDSSIFVGYLVPLCCIILNISEKTRLPNVSELVALNMLFSVKSIGSSYSLFQNDVFLEALFLIALFSCFLYFFVRRIMSKGYEPNAQNSPIIMGNVFYSAVPSSDLGSSSLAEVYVQEPDLADYCFFNPKKYFGLILYPWEVLLDNILLYQLSKEKKHVLPLPSRAVFSPIAVAIIFCLYNQVTDLFQYLFFVTIGGLVGGLNLLMTRKLSLYRLLMFYNYFILSMIELLVLDVTISEKGFINAGAYSKVLGDVYLMLQLSIPLIGLALKNTREGIEGIALTAQMICQTYTLLFSSALTLYSRIMQGIQINALTTRITSSFTFAITILPFILFKIQQNDVYNDVGIPLLSLLGLYYLILYKKDCF